MSILKKIFSLTWKFCAIVGIPLLLFILFVIFTNPGLRFVLFVIPTVGQNQVQGTIYQGFNIQGLKVETGNYTLLSDEVQWVWQDTKNKTEKLFLEVKLIDLGNLAYTKKVHDEINVAKLPKSLRLPFDFKIERIHIGSISIDGTDNPVVENAVFNVSYLNNTYSFEIEKVIIFSSLNKGSFFFKDKGSYELAGRVDSYSLDDHSVRYGFIEVGDTLEYPLVQVNINSLDLDIHGFMQFSPFDPIVTRKILSANIVGNKINPQRFLSKLSDAELSFKLVSKVKKVQSDDVVTGVFNIKNARPDYFEKNGIPIKEINLDFDIFEDGTVKLSKGSLHTMRDGGGIQAAYGKMNPDGSIDMQADVKLGLVDFMPTLIKNIYQGQATLTGTYVNPRLNIDVNSPWNKLEVDAQFTSKEKFLIFNKFILSKQNNYFEGKGQFHLQDKFDVDLEFLGKNFDPSILSPHYPKGSINGQVQVRGDINKSLYVKADIKNSQISNYPFFANGFVDFTTKKINEADFKLSLDENHFTLKGKMQDRRDKMHIDMYMPNLKYFGLGLSGKAIAKGYVQGTYDKLIADIKGQLNHVKIPSVLSLDFLNFDINISPNINAPLKVDLKGNGLNLPSFSVSNISSLFTGTLVSHSGNLQFNIQLPNREALVGKYSAKGGFNKDYVWTGTVTEFNLSGFINLILQGPIKAQSSVNSLKIGSGQWRTLGGSLYLNYFEWNRGKGFKTKGQVSGLQLSVLQSFIDFPFEQDITVQGDWDLIYNKNASGYIKLQKQAGDIIFSQRKTSLGLENLSFNAQLFGNNIKALLEAKTRFISGRAEFTVLQEFGKKLQNSPIKGVVKLGSNNIGAFKYTLPVGMDLKGTIDSDINLSGTVGNPKLNGYLRGENIEYSDLSSGIFLRNGKFDSRLVGRQWVIDGLSFKDKDGYILLKGVVGEINKRYGIDLSLMLDHYLLMNQPNRQFVVSGQAKIRLDDNTGITLTGDLKLDRGKYENLTGGMPKLSDDVHIVGSKKNIKTDKTLPFMLDVTIDLNDKLRFILRELNFLLGGKLRLTAKKDKKLKVVGGVTALEGHYRAYGQNLVLEKGSLSFAGDPLTASLNVRAKRYQSPVGAGVDVTGTLINPKVSLIADIAMDDGEKLSWLILGRESKGEDDNEALALAVGVLAAEKVNRDTGSILDNIGLISTQKRNTNTGELNPAEQMVTFGKQVNDNLYMSYEFGVQSSSQAVRLIYAISKSLSVFIKVGTESGGGGMKYKARFD